MKKISLFILGAFLLFLSNAIAAPLTKELIVNGGFEDGITGWSVSGADEYYINTLVGAHGGSLSFWGYDNNGYATLSQTVSTTIGDKHDFSFWSNTSLNTAANILGYSFDNGVTTFTVNTTSTLLWEETATSFIASSNYTDIEFYFQTVPGTGIWIIDDVSLKTTPTPIPAAIWIFGSGLAGLAGLRRRKMKRV